MKRLLVIAICLASVTPLRASEQGDLSDSPAYHLAVIDAGRALPTDAPSVRQFQRLLTYLSRKTNLTEEQIADKTTAVRDKLKDDYDFKVSAMELLTNVFVALRDSPAGSLTFENALTSVATIMYTEKR